MKVAVAIVYGSEHGVSPEGYEIIDIQLRLVPQSIGSQYSSEGVCRKMTIRIDDE